MLKKENIYTLPILHYTMEMAAYVRQAFEEVKPDVVAVELPETMQLQMLHAASRLPDLSVILSFDRLLDPIYYMCEPCDPCFEALRSALESGIDSFCIDLDVDEYPDIHEYFPDPYSSKVIGLDGYYKKIIENQRESKLTTFDKERELFMAKRLKELSLKYDKVLFVSGMVHAKRVIDLIDRPHFPEIRAAEREATKVITITEESSREVMAEYAWLTAKYEEARENPKLKFPPDRQQLLIDLFLEAAERYKQNEKGTFTSANLRTLLKYSRNYALVTGGLIPDLFQIITAAKGCIGNKYAYELWELATNYPYLKNVDNLDALDLTAEDIWGNSKQVQFRFHDRNSKSFLDRHRQRKDRSKYRFEPPGAFTICSYPPEDIKIENFGEFLKKKATTLMSEEAARTIPFSTSLEDGIDTRETIRHYAEKKLYVKSNGRPPGGVGSVVMIFDEDSPTENKVHIENYPWKTTWLGEHDQESDMAFYATPMTRNIVGPGISRCEYGGFMMSYPPRRMFDVWSDPDYQSLRNKSEILLAAAIDYSTQKLITYVASTPPREALKSYARRFGKKIVYIPVGQLSPITLRNLRHFHVLDNHGRRDSASEYID